MGGEKDLPCDNGCVCYKGLVHEEMFGMSVMVVFHRGEGGWEERSRKSLRGRAINTN